MSRFYNNGENGDGTAFRDVLFGVLGVLAAVVVILLLLPKHPEEAQNAQARSRGNIRVEVMWPDDYNVDIDTWGKAPGTIASVGYSNKNGNILNLLRDDLGIYADVSGRNYEIMHSRGLPAGEWIFNIHWFSNAAGKAQVSVDVIITITKDDSSKSKERPQQIVATKLVLTRVGEEQTVIRFKLDDKGDIIPNSMTSLFVPIRSATSGR